MSINRRTSAPRGSEISCKSWQTEAALRMLMNNLDADVAEKTDERIVCGGTSSPSREVRCQDPPGWSY